MPPRRTTPPGYEIARRLRQEPTPAESKLWAYMRGSKLNGINFRRQHAIGRYVADFCSPKAKLIIELDGSQHLEQEGYDTGRTEFLKSKGYRVLRFWNSDVMNNINDVIGVILEELDGWGVYQTLSEYSAGSHLVQLRYYRQPVLEASCTIFLFSLPS